ncbi:hypothetical protein D018_0903B, partial [Vibrio parahaemolyticus VP2007-007]
IPIGFSLPQIKLTDTNQAQHDCSTQVMSHCDVNR